MMNRSAVIAALLVGASSLSAQSWRESMARTGIQSVSYSIKTPANETVSEMAFPFYVKVPIMRTLTIDVGTSYASVDYERRLNDSTVNTSKLSGMTDTQLRANY